MKNLAPGPCWGCKGPKYIGDGRYCETCKGIRQKKVERSSKAHAKRVENLYGITAEEYAALLEFQGGACAICRRKPGKKRLAVDHAHDVEVLLGKRASVRGLLCRGCNYGVLGHLGDSPEAIRRAIEYIELPPALEVLK